MTYFKRTGIAAMFFLVALNAACSNKTQSEVAYRKIGDGNSLVVYLGGSEGGFPYIPFLTEELRSRDIAVAEVAYFGFEPDGPKHLQEINIESIANVINDLGAQHACVGILGVSKGAELALLLATYHPVSDVTVAMVPSHVVWQSSRVSLRNTSSWSLNGKPLDFVAYDIFSLNAVRAVFDVTRALPLHIAALGDHEAERRAAIPVERITQPVLLQSAIHDQIWPSTLMANRIIERLDRDATGHSVSHIAYDHDHFLLTNDHAVSDLLSYFSSAFEGCGGEG